MMVQKKAMQKRRKGQRDTDIINDNDELIQHLINEMRTCADVSLSPTCTHTILKPWLQNQNS